MIASRPHHKRFSRRRGLRLVLEKLENRQLLAGDGFLQGYAFVDVNGNNALDDDDTRKVGATIELRSADGTTLIDSVSTDSDGYYRFQDLDAGTYQLKEIPPSNFVNQATEINTSLSSATQINAGTIEVTLVDPGTRPDVFVDRVRNLAGVSADFDVFDPVTGDPGPYNNSPATAHQYEIRLSLDGGTTFGDPFFSFCTDLFHANPEEYSTTANIIPEGPGHPLTTNVGQIAYLYNEFGREALSAADGTGLQLVPRERFGVA